MNFLETIKTACPYCGEAIELLVDCSVEQQIYIEDCFVCCRPITVDVHVGPDGSPTVQVFAEND